MLFKENEVSVGETNIFINVFYIDNISYLNQPYSRRCLYMDRGSIHCFHSRHSTVLLAAVYGEPDHGSLKFTHLRFESREKMACYNLPTVETININTITLNNDITCMKQSACVCMWLRDDGDVRNSHIYKYIAHIVHKSFDLFSLAPLIENLYNFFSFPLSLAFFIYVDNY